MRVTTGPVGLLTAEMYRGLLLVAVALASCAAVVAVSATFMLRDGVSSSADAAASPASPAAAAPTPSAVEFGVIFVETANAFAASQDESRRVANADCVQGSPGHYMCAYVSKRRGEAGTCHVMQATWTPGASVSVQGRCSDSAAAVAVGTICASRPRP